MRNQTSVVAARCCDAEASASSDASASCYSSTENVRVLAVVMTKLEFSEVQRQILLAYVVVVADDSALQEAPEILNVVRMNLTAYIFASAVTDCLMGEAYGVQMGIAAIFVGRYKVN